MTIEREWLKSKLDTDLFLSDGLISFPEIGIRDYQVDLENVEMLGSLQSGDEVWIFSSPKDDWESMCGRAGLALVRDNEIVGSYVIFVN